MFVSKMLKIDISNASIRVIYLQQLNIVKKIIIFF